MMRLFHRALYISGIVLFYGSVFLDVFLPTISQKIPADIKDVFDTIGALFLIYFFPTLIYALYKLTVSQHSRKLVWLIIILFIPFAGAFFYFERHIFIDSKQVISLTPDKLHSLLLKQTESETNIQKLMWRRALAFVTDYGCLMIFYNIYFYLLADKSESVYQLMGVQHLVVGVLFWFFWLPFLESKTGQSIGKKIFNLQVINSNGDRPDIPATVKRHVIDCLDIIFCCVIPILIRQNNSLPRRIGDYLGNTWVIDSRFTTA